jgi:hypothetical protein
VVLSAQTSILMIFKKDAKSQKNMPTVNIDLLPASRRIIEEIIPSRTIRFTEISK